MEFKKIVEAAIKQEESSYKLYIRGYRETSIRSAKILFKKLAGQELRHKKLLQNLDINNVTSFPKSIYYFLHLDDLQLTPLNELNEIKDILKFAIKKEIRAYKQYSGIVKILPFGEMKTFFKKLAGEEQKHKNLVSDAYEKLF